MVAVSVLEMVGHRSKKVPGSVAETAQDALFVVAERAERGAQAQGRRVAAGEADEVDGAAQIHRAVAQRVAATIDLGVLDGLQIDIPEVGLAVGLVERDAVEQDAQAAEVVVLHARAPDGQFIILAALAGLDNEAGLVAQEIFDVGATATVEVFASGHVRGGGLREDPGAG